MSGFKRIPPPQPYPSTCPRSFTHSFVHSPFWGSGSALSKPTSWSLGPSSGRPSPSCCDLGPFPQPLSGPPSGCSLPAQARLSESITHAPPHPSPELGGGMDGRRNEGGDKYV